MMLAVWLAITSSRWVENLPRCDAEVLNGHDYLVRFQSTMIGGHWTMDDECF